MERSCSLSKGSFHSPNQPTATTKLNFLTHRKELVVTFKAPHNSRERWKTGSSSFVHNSSTLRNQWVANSQTVHLNIKNNFFLQIRSTLRELRETEQQNKNIILRYIQKKNSLYLGKNLYSISICQADTVNLTDTNFLLFLSNNHLRNNHLPLITFQITQPT